MTGGTGFIGAALVRRLLLENYKVRVLDNNSRGSLNRFIGIHHDVEFIKGDIRDKATVERSAKGVDGILHLAYVNGTEFFYTHPELVLDVGVKGIVNVLDACRKYNVAEFILASSSEVYHNPPKVPTDENIQLSIPDLLNPRFSYGGGKIICELMAVNYGRTNFNKVMIFRPHNIYGPDMGFEHVIPQMFARLKLIMDEQERRLIDFPIQGNGSETRSFCYIDDLVEGVMKIIEKGEHLNIYNIGTTEEVKISELARKIGLCFNRQLNIIPGQICEGGPKRRCPDIKKLSSLGYCPKIHLELGLKFFADWYVNQSVYI